MYQYTVQLHRPRVVVFGVVVVAAEIVVVVVDVEVVVVAVLVVVVGIVVVVVDTSSNNEHHSCQYTHYRRPRRLVRLGSLLTYLLTYLHLTYLL